MRLLPARGLGFLGTYLKSVKQKGSLLFEKKKKKRYTKTMPVELEKYIMPCLKELGSLESERLRH